MPTLGVIRSCLWHSQPGLSFLSEEKKKQYDGTRYLTISLFSKYALARMSCIL